MGIVNGVNVCGRCGKQIKDGNFCEPQCELLIVDKVDEPEDGGRFTYVSGYAFPFKGYPDVEAQKQINLCKRTLISSIELAISKPIIYFLGLSLFLPKNTKHKIYCLLFNNPLVWKCGESGIPKYGFKEEWTSSSRGKHIWRPKEVLPGRKRDL